MITDDLVEYLASKGVQVRRANGAEVIAHCFFCEESKRSPKLYLNRESWLYDCKLCGQTGNRKTLLRHFGDSDQQQDMRGYADANVRRQILADAAAHAHELLLDNEHVMEYLLDRGLAPQTIVDHQIGFVPPNLSFSRDLGDWTVGQMVQVGLMHDSGGEFFNNSITIPYHHHGAVVQLRAKDLHGRYRTVGGENVRLFNEDALHGAERALVVEGEFDALIAAQHLAASGDPLARSIAVVAVPGAGAFPTNIGDYFSGMKRVYIGFDPDPPGQTGTTKVKEALGSVGRVVDLPREQPKCDWTEFLRDQTPTHPHGGHGWRDVMGLIAKADLVGRRVFSISETQARWEAAKNVHQGIKLGWPSMDARLKPGLQPGQIMIPLAKTGTGKTSFLANVAHNTRSHRVLFLSLELTSVELFGMLRRIHFFWNPAADAGQIAQDYRNLRIVDENRLRKNDFATLIAEYAEDVGEPPEMVILDYLGYYARGFAGGSPYEKTSDAVMQLKAEAKDAGVVLIAPHQVNRAAKEGVVLEADHARDSGVVEETGDFVLSLFRPDQAIGSEATTGTFSAQLLKSRHGGKGALFNLRFSNMSLAIVDALDRKHAHLVEQENALYQRGVDYEDFRKRAGRTQLSLVPTGSAAGLGAEMTGA